MPASNQLATWADMATAGVRWTGTQPGTSETITEANYAAQINHDGSAPWGYASNQCMAFADMQAHKVLATLQSTAMTSGNHKEPHYTATLHTGTYTCSLTTVGAANNNNTITVNAGTVAPVNAGSQISITVTGITYSFGATQMAIQIKNPSGTIVQTSSSASSATSFSTSYSAAGAPAGAWQFFILCNPNGTAACDSVSGTSGGDEQIAWTGGSFSSYY